MRSLAAHGIRPDTDLGQHFLLDENLVNLAIREGGVHAGDVVLEIGAGLGVLTAPLTRAASWVHAVELDRRLEPALADALAGHDNVTVHWGDAMRLPLDELTPPADGAGRQPALLDRDAAGAREPVGAAVARAVVRDGAARGRGPLARGPRRPALWRAVGAAATGHRVTFRRSVGREVFTPRPRVDSALVALRRTGPGPSPAVRRLVRAAFATRRKTLVNALALAGGDRARVAAALERPGPVADRPAGGARARRLRRRWRRRSHGPRDPPRPSEDQPAADGRTARRGRLPPAVNPDGRARRGGRRRRGAPRRPAHRHLPRSRRPLQPGLDGAGRARGRGGTTVAARGESSRRAIPVAGRAGRRLERRGRHAGRRRPHPRPPPGRGAARARGRAGRVGRAVLRAGRRPVGPRSRRAPAPGVRAGLHRGAGQGAGRALHRGRLRRVRSPAARPAGARRRPLRPSGCRRWRPGCATTSGRRRSRSGRPSAPPRARCRPRAPQAVLLCGSGVVRRGALPRSRRGDGAASRSCPRRGSAPSSSHWRRFRADPAVGAGPPRWGVPRRGGRPNPSDVAARMVANSAYFRMSRRYVGPWITSPTSPRTAFPG